MTPEDSQQARIHRDELASQVSARTGASHRVINAIHRVPRHAFMPPDISLAQAYNDGPYPIGNGQTISQPTVVAMMTEALALDGSERVLEVGTGSGYQTAVLAETAEKVYTIEVIAKLGERARKVLESLGYDNIEFRIGDGYQGWPEAAPFDRMILTAAPREVPRTLVDQLSDGGMIVGPVGERFSQQLLRVTRNGETVQEEYLGAVAFVPMVPGEP